MEINKTGKTSSVASKSKANRKNKTQGTRFADMLKAAAGATQSDKAGETDAHHTGTDLQASRGKHESVPKDAKGRGHYLLERLEELEQDILSGSPTQAVEHLKNALESEAMDVEHLSPKAKKLLKEIDLRASIEIAKLEESNK